MAVSYDNLKNHIGTNCGFHRRLQGLAISDVAEKSGLTFETVSEIEDYSRKFVTSAEVKALADAFGISQDRLFDTCPKAEDSEQIDEKKAKYALGKAMAKQLREKKRNAEKVIINK